ncbi:peptidoglycan editing factor PgeF [uncultured Cocleimonas sp.]|uniref:peptidoglycan editing factor PgeF n=1 Tax=uncultured Cocleimonas sp. TaxID=1051587 RepID=UPI0026310D1E|nr:peptidoglycan editing factor PgeF [uncultured Cocleimonas sp.]
MGVEYKQSIELSAVRGVRHGFFTKSGGVSSGIYDSLNCGPASADSLDNVIENRWRAISALGLQESQLFGLNQIHSTKVHTIDKKSSDDYHPGDGLVTKEKGMALSVLGADCAPVLFADKTAGVIGAAHSGWKGSVSGIIESMVESMCVIGASRENIHACIGPTIHQKSYEVREDFIQQLESLSGFATEQFIKKGEKEVQGQFFFDLPAYLLEQCKRSQIQGENLGLDTYELDDSFFSFRRNTHQGLTEYGRQISVICLA